jgi:hypothetical protein
VRKRFRIGVAILLAALLAGWLVWAYALSREPRYQGQTLTDWLVYNDALSWSVTGSSNSQAKYKASVYAIRQIGTNAIPVLLLKISAKDNPLQRHLRSWAHRQSFYFDFPDRAQDRALARNGFSFLGADGLGAAPALIKLTQDPNAGVRSAALDSLVAINPQPSTLVPILLAALHDPDTDIRDYSRFHLLAQFPEVAKKAGLHHGGCDLMQNNPTSIFTGTTATNK